MAIREEIIAVATAHGLTVQNRWHRHDDPASDRLLVMLPGDNYTCNTGVLYYLRGMALQNGYDVLSLEYGFQAARTRPDPTGLMAEVKEPIEQVLARGYRKVCFAGKSIGSPLAFELAHATEAEAVSAILLTPLAGALDPTLGLRALAVIGTADEAFGTPDCQAARERGEMEWLVLEGLTHGLVHRTHWEQSLAALHQILRTCERFLTAG